MKRIEIFTIGGFEEITKNMTAIKYDDEIVILDMGVYMPAIVDYQEEGDIHKLSEKEIIAIGAVPDDTYMLEHKHKVKGIFLGHSHLDHIAAVPFLAKKYQCPIYGSPYTIEVLRTILKDYEKEIPNKLRPVSLDTTVKVSNNLQVEFISITHSTLQCALMAVHTPQGAILYSNDFKLDNTPILGKKPNYQRLKELGKQGVLCLITETMYAKAEGKCPSEKIARELLREVMFDMDFKGKAIFLTAFSSHIVRIKTAVEFGKKLKRKIVILGRSMEKYIGAARNIRIIDFGPDVKVYSYKNSVERVLKDIHAHPGKYMVICTGSQGEPNSILDKILAGRFHFKFNQDDIVIFSTSVIPVKKNIENRELLEKKLSKSKVRMFKDVHVSGHGFSEDLRELIMMTKPQYIIPAQGEDDMREAFMNLCKNMGYKKNQLILAKDGEIIKL